MSPPSSTELTPLFERLLHKRTVVGIIAALQTLTEDVVY